MCGRTGDGCGSPVAERRRSGARKETPDGERRAAGSWQAAAEAERTALGAEGSAQEASEAMRFARRGRTARGVQLSAVSGQLPAKPRPRGRKQAAVESDPPRPKGGA